jgi:hypothetical protein
MMVEPHAADFLLAQFTSLENQLKKWIEFVPYVDANKCIVSPKLTPILMEACSLIDSVFCSELSPAGPTQFKKYAEELEPTRRFGERMSLFLVAPIHSLNPFHNWNLHIPIWWNAYNRIKHDRLNSIDFATYENVVNAMCGLHQVMSACKSFLGAFLRAGWIDTTDNDLFTSLASVAHLGALHPAPPSMVIESQLFVSPTRENFLNSDSAGTSLYFDVDYDMANLSNRIRNYLWSHEDF